jgi:hypothetical protein
MEADAAEVAAATDGVTASFIKEMIRRTALMSLRAGEHPPVLRGEYFTAVLAEMNGEHHALTRALLGAGDGDGERAPTQRRPRVSQG